MHYMCVEVEMEWAGMGTESMQGGVYEIHKNLQYFRGSFQWPCVTEIEAERRGMMREISR